MSELICGCGDSPASEPIYDEGLKVYSALCRTCKDWSDFQLVKERADEYDKENTWEHLDKFDNTYEES